MFIILTNPDHKATFAIRIADIKDIIRIPHKDFTQIQTNDENTEYYQAVETVEQIVGLIHRHTKQTISLLVEE